MAFWGGGAARAADREEEPAVAQIGSAVGGVNRTRTTSAGGNGAADSPEMVSDLPCVTEGKCPLPAFRCPK